MEIILGAIIFLILYTIGAVLAYVKTGDKIYKQNKQPSEEEAKLLMCMILFYPLFFAEINTIIKHMEQKRF